MNDIVIIGGGPAGLSAAITAKARNKDVLIIGNDISTSALYGAETVSNYLGMQGISGKQMLETFIDHAKGMGVDFVSGKAQQILSMGEYFSINAGDMFYEAKTVILATGKKTGSTIEGEKEFLGKGLSYCATCDGMLYKGKIVVITGNSDEMMHDALFLSEICNKVFIVSNKRIEPPSADNIEVINGKITSINGGLKIQSITVGDKTIECNGVFIISDSLPAESLVYGIEMENGCIKTDKDMRTNVAGVFAAGDCTGKPLQISKATGDGLVAALSAVRFL